MNTEGSPLHGVLSMAGGTMVSRLLGFARDVLLAHLLGPGADVFLVAFRVPNFLRRLLAEGSLGMAYAAAFSRTVSRQGYATALAFARRMRLATLLASLPLTALLMAAATPLTIVMAPGLVSHPEMSAQAALLLRICLPYLPLCSVCAIFYATHACSGYFRPQAYGSVLLNIAIIAAAFGILLWPWLTSQALPPATMRIVLCLSVVAGGVLQVLFSGAMPAAPAFDSSTPRVSASPPPPLFRDAAILAVLKKTPGLALGAAAHQLHVLVGTMLASFLATGSISALYFAERLFELPLGIAGAAVGVVALPRLSSLAATRDISAFAHTLGQGIRLGALLSLPAAVGLFCIAVPLTRLLFGHGAYGDDELAVIARCLAAYAPGLPAMCAVRPLLSATTALASHSGGRNPALFATLASVFFAALASLALMPVAGAPGIALGSASGAWCNAFLLRRYLLCHAVPCPFLANRRSLVAYSVAAIILGVCLSGILAGLDPLPHSRIALAFILAVLVACSAGVWVLGWWKELRPLF